MEARIPFGGFYESMWSSGIDDQEESYAEHLAEEHDVPQSDVAEILFKHTKYHDCYAQVAEDYVSCFKAFINEGLGMKIKLTYNDMTSPKYYNFETDNVFADLSYPDALRLARRVGRNALRKAAKDMFTSRDGFISFYRNDISEWGPLRTWDHNQLYCLLTAAVDVIDDENWEWSLYENMEFYPAYDKGVDYPAVMLEIGKLVAIKEAAEEAEEQDDGKRFPVAWKDTADYVAKFNKMNSNGLSEGEL
jgi:hypothetical protein